MLVSLACLAFLAAASHALKPGDEAWDYVDVRDGAHMFWWLYATTNSSLSVSSAPTILWLQGGPGGSSTGFGNFVELGPLDVALQPRNTTWTNLANVLFVDNPVGTGYSYVDDEGLLAANGSQIAADLFVTLDAVFSAHSDLQGPFYVFCESFGGWMTTALVHAWLFGDAGVTGKAEEARQRLVRRVNLRGMTLGDSWVSPIDYVDTWAPYLYGLGVLNDADMETVGKVTAECDKAVKDGEWTKAWNLWGDVENVITELSDDVDWYYALTHHPSGETTAQDRLLGRLHEDPLTALMNGPIREKLGVIPKSVTWGGQAGAVFTAMNESFMQSQVTHVDNILKNDSVLVTIENGGLDLICCTIGTERWMRQLTWHGMPAFQNASKLPIVPPTGPDAGTLHSQAFLQRAGKANLQAYWIFGAGHMAPAQTPDMALEMVRRILND